MRDFLGKLALMVGAIAVALLVAEVALRIFRPFGAEVVTGDQYQFYSYDPVLGWSNTPGINGTFKRAEFSYPLRINRQGLRGAEVSLEKPSGIKRIAVLGDSFTWGIGASEEELFVSRMQHNFNDVEVLNFGVSGYAPVQHYLMKEKILSFNPDLIVIAFCLGNDFTDNVFQRRYGYYKPFARLDDNKDLVIDGYPITNVKDFGDFKRSAKTFFEKIYIVRLFNNAIAKFENQGGPGNYENIDIYNKTDGSNYQYVIDVNTALIKGIVSEFDKVNIPVIVAAVPTKCEFGGCFKGEKFDRNGARNALKASLQGLNVTHLDPTDEFKIDDFWKSDGHWRASGHEKFAKALFPALSRLLEKKEDVK